MKKREMKSSRFQQQKKFGFDRSIFSLLKHRNFPPDFYSNSQLVLISWTALEVELTQKKKKFSRLIVYKLNMLFILLNEIFLRLFYDIFQKK